MLVLSLIASPVLAQARLDEFPAPPLPLVTDISQQVISEPQFLQEPSTEQEFLSLPTQDNVLPVCESKYWIVSSRCAVQNIHSKSLEPWGLDVYERNCGGQLIHTSLDMMSAQLDPSLPICVFSHGSFVNWELQCREAHAAFQRLQHCTSSPVQFIFFTWPSDGPFTFILPVDVGVRGNQAEFNGFHMAHLLSRLPQHSRVSLIGHSHGARVMLSALHLSGGGTILGHVFNGNMGYRRYRLILAAAATDHNWLNPGQRYGCSLNSVECMLNFRNSEDLALAFYPLARPLFTSPLGRRGFSRRDQMKLGAHAAKIRTVDVTCQLGHEHLWPDYYNKQVVVSAIMPYICY